MAMGRVLIAAGLPKRHSLVLVPRELEDTADVFHLRDRQDKEQEDGGTHNAVDEVER